MEHLNINDHYMGALLVALHVEFESLQYFYSATLMMNRSHQTQMRKMFQGAFEIIWGCSQITSCSRGGSKS